jgi:hypothetical protein
VRLRPLRRPVYSLPGDRLVADYIDGPQRVYPRAAANRAQRREILFRERPRYPAKAWREACAKAGVTP